jgi:hypothetical protein
MTDTPLDLSTTEARLFSQNGEDGVIATIFGRIGTTNRQSLEFGAHPDQCNTRALKEAGWQALCWDSNEYTSSDGIEIGSWFRQRLVLPGTINALWREDQLPDDLDFLSIDVDGNDFHLWHSLAPTIRPRVVCIEHNSKLGPSLDKVIPIHRVFQWDGSDYFGASLRAMVALGRKRGYTLVYVESTGVNAFFVRDEDAPPGTFAHQGDVKALYRPPNYRFGGSAGHPPDPFCRPYQHSSDYLRLTLPTA